MPGPAPRLLLSPSEHVILEAVVASSEIPERIRKRAQIVLLAGEGMANAKIAVEVGLSRAQVIEWRKRYSREGVRGLWDKEHVPPKERIPFAIKQLVVKDCLYTPATEPGSRNPLDFGLTWTLARTADRHGLSRSTVQRIRKRYGIQMLRYRGVDQGIELDKLNVSMDPLFGITFFGVALFYEGAGPVLALCDRPCQISGTEFSNLSSEGRQGAIGEFAARLRKLSPKSIGPDRPSPDLLIRFFEEIETHKIDRDTTVLLLVSRLTGAHWSTAVRTWLSTRPNFKVIETPLTVEKFWKRCGRRTVRDPKKGLLTMLPAAREHWVDFIHRYLTIVAKWPFQTRLLSDMFRLSQHLREVGWVRDRIRSLSIKRRLAANAPREFSASQLVDIGSCADQSRNVVVLEIRNFGCPPIRRFEAGRRASW